MSRARSAFRASPAIKPLEYLETMSSCCASASIVFCLVAKVSGNFILNFSSRRFFDFAITSACSSTFNLLPAMTLSPVLTPVPIPKSIRAVFPPSVRAYDIFLPKVSSFASGVPKVVSKAKFASAEPIPVLSAVNGTENFPGPTTPAVISVPATAISLVTSNMSFRLGAYSSANMYLPSVNFGC